ncbi:Bug family tripartite tricarboxylate transporter substrate binding protein [Propylenella binzhouense]|uniref:Tripartite tricarboxylate transporter substrate binding protein n=1 Tax=Propylenella binzhouense TaxID=2555902 RepID=A0A964T876_9HYPH|nr:tripartite tricarboxylate transporter substrate binding protein [Propylenella binzhouense]MYZ49574.1 tripartite tricarboxylate transporter substrate binding protein [Propylenella binzhouense]
MTSFTRRSLFVRTLGAAGLALTLASVPFAAAEAGGYPEKPVKILVPVAPGGPMDMIGRLVAEKLGAAWGQPFVVENRPGGGQVIATQVAAQSPADGYTLLVMSHVFTMNPWLFDRLPYGTDDFAPVTQMTETPLILAVNPKLPVNSVKELIDYAKAHPGELSFGSSGPSSSLRFAGELLKEMAGIDMVHVPFDGNGPMTVAVASGEIDLGFVNPVSIPFIKDGRLRALAITSRKRADSLPDLSTMQEAGVAGYEAGSWFGLVAPKGTPDDVIAKLNGEIGKILSDPEVKARLEAVEATPVTQSPEEFAAYIASELQKWKTLIGKLDIKVQ